jgi:cytochrome c peroxidase
MSSKSSSKALPLVLSIMGGCLMFILSMALGGVLYAEISSKDLPKEKDVEKARKIIINVKTLDQMEKLPGDLVSLPAAPIPADNPQTDAKVELGKMLFFDKRLSGDKLTSCATCHDPTRGYSDGKALAIGFGGKELGRHSPTVMNVAYNGSQFWDGRAATMEEQAEKPIEAEVEMNLPRAELAKRLNNVPEYKKRFRAVFGEDANLTNVGKAIAAFERTIVTPDSPFDQYERGNKQALSEQEKKGLVLFVSKAACSQCHNGPNFTDSQFHALGVPQKGPLAEDLGRYAVTKDEKDKGAFKTPSLRSIALSAPYMHDGAFETLEEVVDFYNQGGGTASNKSPKILKLNLTKQEKKDLVAFLRALTGKLPVVSLPQLPKDR